MMKEHLVTPKSFPLLKSQHSKALRSPSYQPHSKDGLSNWEDASRSLRDP